MITTKIQVKPHLAEYLRGKYGAESGVVRLPDDLDLYHTLWDLLIKRPTNSIDVGNLELVLPDRRVGKSPEAFNYLSERGRTIMERRIEVMLWAELHDYLDEQKHCYGVEYADGVHVFKSKYVIGAITDDALLKNYYRWRDRVRKKKTKRDYKKSEK